MSILKHVMRARFHLVLGYMRLILVQMEINCWLQLEMLFWYDLIKILCNDLISKRIFTAVVVSLWQYFAHFAVKMLNGSTASCGSNVGSILLLANGRIFNEDSQFHLLASLLY